MNTCKCCGQTIMDADYFKEIEGTPEMHFLVKYQAWKKSQKEQEKIKTII